MDTRKILADLRSERDRINQAINAIEELGATGSPVVRRGRAATATQATAQPRRGRRGMSAAGRQRLSAMMKTR